MRPARWAGSAVRLGPCRRGSVAAIVAVALALLGSWTVSADPAVAVAGSFTISPVQGPAGTTVQIAGACGFAAETVSYGVFGMPSTFHLFQPVTDADGAFVGQLAIPVERAGGKQVADRGDLRPVEAHQVDLGQAVFTVDGGPATLPPALRREGRSDPALLIPGFWISPQSGPVGTTISITGFCGYPAATISYSLTYPDETGLPIPSVYVLGETLPHVRPRGVLGHAEGPRPGPEVPQYPGPTRCARHPPRERQLRLSSAAGSRSSSRRATSR